MFEYFKAKLKSRLDKSDILNLTETTYEYAANSISDLIEAVEKSEPNLDIALFWRESFEENFVNLIAQEETKRAQALKCRLLLLKVIEDHAKIDAIFDLQGESELVAPLMARSFFEEYSGKEYDDKDDLVMRNLAQQFVLDVIDLSALKILYKYLFSYTLNIDEFFDEFSNLCKVEAKFGIRIVGNYAVRQNSDSVEESHNFVEELIVPAYNELEIIKSEYIKNLQKLQPKKPSNAFEKWRKGLEKILSEVIVE